MQTVSAGKGLLLILSGPAGSGKTTLSSRLLAEHPTIERVVTATTRAPRPGEIDGEDYFFYPSAVFEEMIAAGAFYEHARIHDYYYGTPCEAVDKKLAAGVDLLLVIDVQGAAAFREAAARDADLAKRLLTIFVNPASLEQVRERMEKRGTDDAPRIERRMRTACEEIKQADTYDHIIVSGEHEADFRQLVSLYLAAR